MKVAVLKEELRRRATGNVYGIYVGSHISAKRTQLKSRNLQRRVCQRARGDDFLLCTLNSPHSASEWIKTEVRDSLFLSRPAPAGATIVNRPEELKESDIGTGAGLFEVQKLGDEYFTFIVDCEAPKACTVLLRGASKDVLNEVERNLHVSRARPALTWQRRASADVGAVRSC